MNKESVNHPSHYQSKVGLEVIDVIKAFTAELKGEEAFCTGNVIKYICRWKSKNGIEDLKKAKWYLARLINQIEKPYKEAEVIFDEYDVAVDVLLALKTRLVKYGYVSVLDLHNFCVIPSEPAFDLIGWRSLEGVNVVKYDDKLWTINFPTPIELEKESKNNG